MDGLAVYAGYRATNDEVTAHAYRGSSRVMVRRLIVKLAACVDKIDDSAGHGGRMGMQIRRMNVVAHPTLVDVTAVPSRPCPRRLTF